MLSCLYLAKGHHTFITPPTIMECPVCYCATASCKLVCGHGLCRDCATSWYKKSDEPNCPMCREPMYFRGMRQIKNEMEEDRFEEHCTDLFTEAIEDIFEDWELELLELRKAGIPAKLHKLFLRDFMQDIMGVEKKIQVMRDQGWDVELMRTILEGWEFQYREKFWWGSDISMPFQVPVSRYPQWKGPTMLRAV